MPKTELSRQAQIRAAIDAHLSKRLQHALERIRGSDKAAEKRREDLKSNFQLSPLIEAAILSVGQIQRATHILKGTYPDAKVRQTTNLLVRPKDLESNSCVGSHLLPDDAPADTTGNGAFVKKTFELALLLEVLFEGKRLIDWLTLDDRDVTRALECEEESTSSVTTALISLFQDRCKRPASHTNAKQLYWLTGTDAHDEQAFHLLAPLYPTSLVHRVYLQLQDDRFSDEAKAARAARKAGEPHSRPVREYSNLAIQKLGGTKPQNISQLNSERRGENCLLASLPPIWQSADVRALLGVDHLFRVFGVRKEVKQLASALRKFLEADQARNVETRRQVSEWLARLIDELVFFQAEFSSLEPGWSLVAECTLPLAQRVWLDPLAEREKGQHMALEDAADEVAADFANWVNQQLRDPLPMGDTEFTRWRKLARDEFAALDREAA